MAIARVRTTVGHRARIDSAFASMADDSDYRREALEIAAEFEIADHESLKLGATDP